MITEIPVLDDYHLKVEFDYQDECLYPVVYSTDRSKAVVLVFFLLSVALWLLHCFLFFSVCVVMLALWSPSSIVAHFAFCFTSCVVVLAFWSPSTAANFAFCFTSCN